MVHDCKCRYISGRRNLVSEWQGVGEGAKGRSNKTSKRQSQIIAAVIELLSSEPVASISELSILVFNGTKRSLSLKSAQGK